jgi:ABC-type branched-subunit amino acid transport system substrate-binding protein
VNYRASYAQETAEMVRGLVSEMHVRPEDIAFLTQNDAYGDSGWNGAVAALKKVGYDAADRLPHGRYPRNTLDVEGALARLLDPTVHPRAIIMIGAYRPCAKFIRLARKNGLRAVFVNVSFVIGDALNRELESHGDGVVITQVVPPPDGDLPVLVEYREVVPAADRSFISLEGFIAAKAFVETLRRAGPGASREQFIDALENGQPFDLGLGVQHVLSKNNHQFSDRVWPTVIRGGQIRPLAKWTDLLRVG